MPEELDGYTDEIESARWLAPGPILVLDILHQISTKLYAHYQRGGSSDKDLVDLKWLLANYAWAIFNRTDELGRSEMLTFYNTIYEEDVVFGDWCSLLFRLNQIAPHAVYPIFATPGETKRGGESDSL